MDSNVRCIAITIQANNVILDMQGFTLQSIPTLFKTIGILAQASPDLQILNGTVRNMGLFGIECGQCINVSIKEVVIDGLTVNDTVNFTQPAGILSKFLHQCVYQQMHCQKY